VEYAPAGGDGGALVRAMVELRPSNEVTRAALATVLGFRLFPARSGLAEDRSPEITTVAESPAKTSPVGHQKSSSKSTNLPSSPDAIDVVPSTLERRESHQPTRWDIPDAPSKALPMVETSPLAATGEGIVTPLLKETWQRSIIYTAMATESEGSEIDTDRLVETMAVMSEVEVLPYRKRSTLRKGGDVLIDSGPGMQPFTHDSQALARLLQRTMPADSIRILYFEGTPEKAGPRGRRTWIPYMPPTSKPVLLVTDLGQSRRLVPGGAGPQEWLEFAALLRGAGCRPLVLTPYGSWLPDELRTAFPVAEWDRSTTAGTVRRLLDAYAAARLR
jgi:hypothetical protein